MPTLLNPETVRNIVGLDSIDNSHEFQHGMVPDHSKGHGRLGKGVFDAWRTRHRIGSSTVRLSDKMDASESTSAGDTYRADQGNMPKVNSKILRQKFSESGMLANLVPIAAVRGGGLEKIGSDSICMPRFDP